MINVIYCFLLAMLIYFCAFFSSSETAFLSLNRIQLRQAIREKKKHANLISRMHQKMDRLLSTVLIGCNTVNTFTTGLATTIAIGFFGKNGAGIATIVVTFLIIVFGEILPKTLATNKPYEIASKRAVPLNFLDMILTPVNIIFEGMTEGLDKFISLFSKNKKGQLITEEELETLIDMGTIEGTIEKNEKHMLKNIVEFGDLRVRDICKPKTFIVAIPDDSDYESIIRTFAESDYSRLPVYHETLDNIIGILHFRDLFKKNSFDLKNSLRPVCYVPETITALSLLRYLKKERQSTAIVVDETGINCGLITMDDIVRSVLGRTMHAFDDSEESPLNRIQILKTNQFIIPGEIKLTDFNRTFSMKLSSDDFDTLGGWLLEQFGSLPNSGEAIKRNNVIFYIEDQAQRRIKSVRMTVL